MTTGNSAINVRDGDGHEFTLYIPSEEGTACYGFIGTDGYMHEYVTANGHVIQECHTPLYRSNRGPAEDA